MIYVDNAATSLHKPDCVIQAVSEYLSHCANPGRGTYPVSMDAARMVLDTRIAIAQYLDCHFSHVIFNSGATEGLNTLIQGLFGQEDHIITSYLEHNSVLRPLYRLGCELSITSADAASIEAAIKMNTKAVILTHVSNVTGEINSLKEIGELCHKHQLLFLVDASQSAGILPIAMKENHIDAVCFSGHKGMMALPGIGVLALGKDLPIHPLKVGGSGTSSFQKNHPSSYPSRLEAGTLNTIGILSLQVALKDIHQVKMATICKHEQQLAEAFYRGIANLPQCIIYREKEKTYLGIVSLNIKGMDAGRVSDRLATQYGIATRAGAHCAPLVHEYYGTSSMVRFSFGRNNTMEEVQACIQAVKEIAKGE